jgi:UDP-N-acetylglucosamine acyltransferase
MANMLSLPARPTSDIRIHPTAVVDGSAVLGCDVEIGPFAIVEAGARLGDRTRVFASAVIATGTEIGPDCEIHFGAVVGHVPQMRDRHKPHGGTIVGARTIIREYATVHRASRAGAYTTIGCDNFLMGACHVAHDCQTGDGVTIANGALLAGCVTIGDHVFISGNVVVHQFVRIGNLAMIGGGAQVGRDVPPFMVVVGRSQVCGVNVIGMRRANMSSAERQAVRRVYRVLYGSGLAPARALERLRAEPSSNAVRALLNFVEGSTRGLCEARTRVRNKPGAGDL